MSRAWWLARRGVLAVAALWAIVTVTFGIVALTPDPNEAVIRYLVAQELSGSPNATRQIQEALEAYRSARNRDQPLTDRYARWLWGVATLQLGISYELGQPVTTLVATRLAVTFQYVLPGMAAATVGGVAVGAYAGLGQTRWSRLTTVASYAVFGVPNFWIAAAAISVVTFQFFSPTLTGYDLGRGTWSVYNLRRLLLPGVLVATGLIAAQARYVRTEVVETKRERFVQLTRAKGAGRLRVARHVLRVALVPLFSLFLAEFLGVLLVTVVVVESVFGIPGFGALTLLAVQERDLPVIIGTTLVVASVGIVGNFLQDVAASVFDPRVES